MSVENPMLQEAISAIGQGDRAHARDLLTRMLRNDKDNPDCWLWMSAVVETPKERIYCLKEVLRIDPENQVARRGLTLFGAAPLDKSLIVPANLQHRSWQVKIEKSTEPRPPVSWRRVSMYGLAGVMVIVLFAVGIFGTRLVRQHQSDNLPTISYRPLDSATPVSALAERVSDTPTLLAPTAPWDALQATYTPTPAYGRTPHPVIEAYSIGLRAYDRGDWATAIPYFQQVINSDPNAADMYYLMGEAYRVEGNDSQAVSAYNSALHVNSDYAPAYLGLVRAGMDDGSLAPSDAYKDLQTAIQLDPDLAEAYLEMASLDLNAARYDDAANDLSKAADLLPNSPLVYLYRAQLELAQQEYNQAVTDATRANQLDVTLLPAYLDLGQALQGAGQMAASIVPLEIYTRYIDPPSLTALISLGQAYAAAGNNDSALAAFSQALEINPQNFDALMQRGALYLRTGQAQEALADFEDALALQKDSFDAAMARAQALLDLDEYGDAYVQLNKAEGGAKTNEQKAELYYYRAQSLETLNASASINDWERLLSLPPGTASQSWLAQAEAHIQALYTPTVTSSPSRTPTITPTPVPSRTPTVTRTVAASRTATATRTLVPSATNTLPSATRTPLASPTRTP